MSSIFNTTDNKPKFIFTKANKEGEKKERKLFINLGLQANIEGEVTFINIPLTLTADDITQQLEREMKKGRQANTEKFKAIQKGKIHLGNLVEQLFNSMDDGVQVLASDLATDENFKLLSKLQVQFVKAGQKKDLEVSNDVEDMFII